MPRFDVLTIGNAIVDIIAPSTDDFLARNGIIKAAMNLIDGERAEKLYAAMSERVETSGGSAGNTAAGVAGFGGKAAYFGKVADDPLGAIYDSDIKAQGVHFGTKPLIGGAPCQQCATVGTQGQCLYHDGVVYFCLVAEHID